MLENILDTLNEIDENDWQTMICKTIMLLLVV